MLAFAAILAAAPADDGSIHVSIGVAIILAALVLVAGALIGGKIFSAPRPKAPQKSRVSTPGITSPQAEGAEIEDGIPAPVLAVIAAAIRTALEDQRFVLRGVRTIDPRESLAWSAEGRRSIYASKNLR